MLRVHVDVKLRFLLWRICRKVRVLRGLPEEELRHLIACLMLASASMSPAFAFEAGTQDVLDRAKVGKRLPIEAVATLMMDSKRWCYFETEGACDWSDIYLAVEGNSATFEISHAWSEDLDIAFVDHGTLEEGRFICESGEDWVPTARLTRRSDDTPLGGRELAATKAEIAAGRTDPRGISCFDYELRGSDPVAETITLLQRQYVDGATDPANDVPVTLHFNAEEAAALTLAY
jgi:hypothetical protein